MCFGQNTCTLTDALVLKRKILHLFDLIQVVHINHINIEDNFSSKNLKALEQMHRLNLSETGSQFICSNSFIPM